MSCLNILAPNFTKKPNGFNFIVYKWDDCVFTSHLRCQWDGVCGEDKGKQCKIANEPNPSGFGYVLIMQFVVLLFLTSPEPSVCQTALGGEGGGGGGNDILTLTPFVMQCIATYY